MNIFSAEQIRQWDQYTIQQEPISSIELMELAAQQCTDWILENLPNMTYKIFCGKGNNGGDGLAIARQMAIRKQQVQVYILEFGNTGSSDFQKNLQQLHACDVTIQFIQNEHSFPSFIETDVVIDCLFGSGLSRPLVDLPAALVQHTNLQQTSVVSIDVPSGMFLDKSSKGNTIVVAQHTLTFQTTKLCFLIPENEPYFGEVHVFEIGLHAGFPANTQSANQLVTEQTIKHLYKPRKSFSHKGTFGHALVVAGSRGKMGACLLSARACLCSGAGLVTAAVPKWGMKVIQTAFPEAMAITQNEMEDIDWSFYQALGIGPGLGTGKEAEELMESTLASFKKPMVIDADGLNLLAKNKDWFSLIPANSILTPHPKEFERLFGKTENDFDKLKVALDHAAKYTVCIVLKGHRTFIATPSGKGYFNTSGNAGMATAGTGDILCGILTGLLAQGYTPENAVVFGVYLHGLAGDLAASKNSMESMIAGDVTENLGKAYLALSKNTGYTSNS